MNLQEVKELEVAGDSNEIIQTARVQSPYLKAYVSFFQHPVDQTLLNNLQELLHNNDIIIDKSKLNNQTIFIKEIRSSFNHEAVMLQVCLGPFILRLNILNKKQCSLLHQRHYLGKGSMGIIYEYQLRGEIFAVKCVHCSDYLDKKSILLSVIQEYCFLKIASALRVGPEMVNYFGFDLICYESCIQFTMQKCLSSLQMTEKDGARLKKSLLKLHLFNIIHFDIKPDNIGFSNHFKKWVFLDFGLTKIIKERPGQMKIMNFIGTIGYCSKQMAKLFNDNSKNSIDPYFNDIIGLSKTFTYLRQIKHTNNIQQQLQYFNVSDFSMMEQAGSKQTMNRQNIPEFVIEKYVRNSFQFMLIQYAIFKSYLIKINVSQLDYSILVIFKQKIAEFLLALPPSSTLRTFYRSYLIKIVQINSQALEKHFTKQTYRTVNSEEQAVVEKSGNMFAIRIRNITGYEINQVNYGNKRDYNVVNLGNKLMTGKMFFLGIQEYYDKYMDFIAFNCVECPSQLNDKIKISIVFMKQHSITCASGDSKLNSIYTCITFILDYCLSEPLDQFKLVLYVKVIQQYLILNIGTTEQIKQIALKIVSFKMDVYQQLRLLIYLLQKLSWLQVRIIYQTQVKVGELKDLVLKQASLQKDNIKLVTHLLVVMAVDHSLIVKDLELFCKMFWLKIHQSNQSWLLLNALSLASHSTVAKIYSSFSKFVILLKQLIDDKNSDCFQSYKLNIANFYKLINDRFSYEHLLNPLKLSMGQMYREFRFSLHSFALKRRRSAKDTKQYINALIQIIDISIQRRWLSPCVMFQMLQIYFEYNNIGLKDGQMVNLFQIITNRIKSSEWMFIQFIDELFRNNVDLNQIQDSILLYYFSFLICQKQYNTVVTLLQLIPKCIEGSCYASIANKLQAIDTCKHLLRNIRRTMKIIDRDEHGLQMLMLQQFDKVNDSQHTGIIKKTQKIFMLINIMNISRFNQVKCLQYALHFYQETASPQFMIYYFTKGENIILYVLQALHREKKYANLCAFIVQISSFLEKYWSIQNFKIINVCFTNYIQIQEIIKNSQLVKDMFLFFRSNLSKYAYLLIIIGLLMKSAAVQISTEIMLGLCRAMDRVNGLVLRVIERKYNEEMARLFVKGRKRRLIEYGLNIRYRCNQQLIRFKKMQNNQQLRRFGLVLKQKIKKYGYNYKAKALKQASNVVQ